MARLLTIEKCHIHGSLTEREKERGRRRKREGPAVHTLNYGLKKMPDTYLGTTVTEFKLEGERIGFGDGRRICGRRVSQWLHFLGCRRWGTALVISRALYSHSGSSSGVHLGRNLRRRYVVNLPAVHRRRDVIIRREPSGARLLM